MKTIIEDGAKPINAWLDEVEVPRDGVFREDGTQMTFKRLNIEVAALQQAKNIARLPFIPKQGIALMPDAHLGKGATVGSVVPTVGAIIPAAVGVDLGCLDKDTEFLTRSGWVKIAQYDGYQDVLGFDMDTGTAAFTKPLAYVKKPNKWFYHLKTQKGLDQMLSPDHKVLFYKGVKNRGYCPIVATADDFVAKHESLAKGLQGGFKSTFTVETSYGYENDNLVRLLVMVSADGCLRENGRIEMHFKKQRKIDRCKQLLESEGISYSAYDATDGSTFIVFTHGHLYTKSLSVVYRLNTHQLGVVAQEAILWDGSESTVDGTTRRYYSTTNKDNADAVQFAFAASGTRAGIYVQKYENAGWNDCYYVIPTKNEFVGIKPGKVAKVDSKDGMAYCFTMPTRFFVARRNNNIFVTGNCGMNAVRLSLKASDLPDSLKRIRDQIERDVPLGAGGRHDRGGVISDRGLMYRMPEQISDEVFAGDSRKAWLKADEQLGTLGSGNHFIELCTDENDDVWVMLHSGSRGIGNMIGTHYIEKAKRKMEMFFINLPDGDLAYIPEADSDFDAYVEAVQWAQDYALENRKRMMEVVIQALARHVGKEFTITDEAINCHHNYISKERHFGKDMWITRKGAIKAGVGDLGIIPGSMGQQSYIVRGKGNIQSYCSCSHGAGRSMSRAEAKRRFSLSDLVAQTAGVECRKDAAVLDEIPSAYKSLDLVMENQNDLVEVVHTLKAVMCVKGN